MVAMNRFTESTSAERVADGVLSALLEGASWGRDKSPAETDPEPEDEPRALALVTATARSRSWKTFIGFGVAVGEKDELGVMTIRGEGFAGNHVELEANTETVNFQQQEIAMRLPNAM
ncbi:hypothetical protein PHYSODRAFT_339898 [Phytophthora sojae]|uniref:Uncharacterized protein n=1 Tax=Phytophthora sojae (strain P6497) TaxID=1094619 RepID=G5A7Z3_PHYSP|nr:hypothetical protein PHYSODRAFT_339898 [Phytophthora sojae]EGZ08019.1 hypothetical protein PHYSODRAFT_339898 [Phytophthora sojae]|eukprot:XP_009536191.1 hypothetical protein PHYSODRAFT_339898 [Phytophthora sojae]